VVETVLAVICILMYMGNERADRRLLSVTVQ